MELDLELMQIIYSLRRRLAEAKAAKDRLFLHKSRLLPEAFQKELGELTQRIMLLEEQARRLTEIW